MEVAPKLGRARRRSKAWFCFLIGPEQFQQKCAAVRLGGFAVALRPELRKNKEIEHWRRSFFAGNALHEGETRRPTSSNQLSRMPSASR
ncbi:hypothetical protein DPM33_27675 [Mesorhizobium hawassense]|uniref:Uncharacterized protein n=1 Tax=Mesorhizobium hawassense TaxID=1209954 RepID=A0A330HG39_9HYPH|nr:hypothetical protein DPM33_27675 [Mesorhizobium hawassense]